MALGTIAPAPKHQFFTDAGVPAAGYKLFTWAAGTTTKLLTYSDAGLLSANTDPIVLDSAGRATIFLSAASYKFALHLPTESDPPVGAAIWTVDNVAANAPFFQNIDVLGVAGETLVAGDGVYMSAGDGALTAGRWYKWDADFAYASANANAIGMVVSGIATGETGAIRIAGRVDGLTGLSIGAPYYISQTAGGITITGQANTRTVGVADSTTSILLSHTVIPQQDVMGRAGEDLAERDAVYLSIGSGSKTAGRWYKTDADDFFASSGAIMVGVAKVAIATGGSGPITTTGRMGGYTALTAGTLYYADATTPGALTATAPANARIIGLAETTTSIRLLGATQVNAVSIQRKRATGTTVNNSTTFVDVDGLAFNIAAGEVWTVEYYLRGSSAQNADIKFRINGPSAPNAVAYGVISATGTPAAGASSNINFGSTIQAATSALDEMFIISAYIDNGVNAGTVQLQFAQDTAQGSDTFIFLNSYLIATKVLGFP